jgi:polygalacturonase
MHMKRLTWICAVVSSGLSAATFNVREFGAVGDGQHKDTGAFVKAVAAAAKAGGGTVLVPPEVESGATLLGSPDPADYPLRDSGWGLERKEISSLIYAEKAEDVTIRGHGTIDGQGQHWWRRMGWPSRMKVARDQRTPEELTQLALLANGRPQLIRLVGCKLVRIEGLHLINSGSWTIHPLMCEFVTVDGVTIENPVPSPNTDGINPQSCRNVQIMNSRIDVGDDCVTLKSGTNEIGRKMGRPDENITITNCVMLRGHGGVTIGSEMSGGVRNVVVSNCIFQGTDVGIRVKSQRGRGGVVEGFNVANVVMQDVKSAFTITTFYQGTDKPGDVFPVNEGTPVFRDFHFTNITVRGGKSAGEITGLKEMPVGGFTFRDVHIQAQTGMKITNAKDVAFLDSSVEAKEGEAMTVVGSTGIRKP